MVGQPHMAFSVSHTDLSPWSSVLLCVDGDNTSVGREGWIPGLDGERPDDTCWYRVEVVYLPSAGGDEAWVRICLEGREEVRFARLTGLPPFPDGAASRIGIWLVRHQKAPSATGSRVSVRNAEAVVYGK